MDLLCKIKAFSLAMNIAKKNKKIKKDILITRMYYCLCHISYNEIEERLQLETLIVANISAEKGSHNEFILLSTFLDYSRNQID
jgi:hypothetical protein